MTRRQRARCAIDGQRLLVDGTCGGCTLRRAGRCIECGASVEGRSWRCGEHKAEHRLLAGQRSGKKHRVERLARERARYHSDPAFRKRHRERKRRWRADNPMKVAMGKRRSRIRNKNGSGYSSRARHLAYQRAYNETHREERRVKARERYYRLHPTRPSPICPKCQKRIPYDGCGSPGKYHYACSPWRKQRKVA